MQLVRPTPRLWLLAVVALMLGSTGWWGGPAEGQGRADPPPPSALATAEPGGQIRAVVIGIDTYKNPDVAPPLSGAVSDARDLARSLMGAGVGDLTVLIDSQATRAAVRRALADVARRASRQDLVVVTFAGHGGQEPERIAGSEPDGRDEYFVLWGFGRDGEAREERILDDEFFVLMGEITGRGAHVLFLADACFGGGMTKAVDPRTTPLPVRSVGLVDRPAAAGRGGTKQTEGASPAAPIPHRDNATIDFTNLSFIAAVDDATLAPEVPVKGEPRGAASYALARALEGLADAEGNGDGHTTRRELFAFVRKHVRILSQDWQSPVVEPRVKETAEIVLFRRPLAAPFVAAAAGPAEPPSGAQTAPHTLAAPSIIRDPRTGDIIDPSGSIVAYAQPPGALATARARLDAYHRLSELARGRALEVTIEPANRDLKLGELFTLRAEGLYGRHVLLVNLAGDGTVQYLFPKGRVDPYRNEDLLTQAMRADEPPGADTIVVIATNGRRMGLEIALSGLDHKTKPTELAQTISTHLDPTDRIGLATYTTRPR